jgi:hypothetical protein
MKIIGAGVVASGLPLSGTAGASHNEPYDEVREDIIDSNGNKGCENEDFAEVHSSVDGPKTVDDNRSTINQGLAVPAGYIDCEDEYSRALDDAKIHVEIVDSPADDTGFDFKNVEPYVHGNNSDDNYTKWLKYAIDFAWDSVPWTAPAPSPADLIFDDDSGPSVSTGGGEFTIQWNNYEDLASGGFGAEWEVDFWSHNGGTPTGDWTWRLTASADVGYLSTGSYDPGFNKEGEFSHEHDIVVSVEDTD